MVSNTPIFGDKHTGGSNIQDSFIVLKSDPGLNRGLLQTADLWDNPLLLFGKACGFHISICRNCSSAKTTILHDPSNHCTPNTHCNAVCTLKNVDCTVDCTSKIHSSTLCSRVKISPACLSVRSGIILTTYEVCTNNGRWRRSAFLGEQALVAG